jgi:hypothetical protein
MLPEATVDRPCGLLTTHAVPQVVAETLECAKRHCAQTRTNQTGRFLC